MSAVAVRRRRCLANRADLVEDNERIQAAREEDHAGEQQLGCRVGRGGGKARGQGRRGGLCPARARPGGISVPRHILPHGSTLARAAGAAASCRRARRTALQRRRGQGGAGHQRDRVHQVVVRGRLKRLAMRSSAGAARQFKAGSGRGERGKTRLAQGRGAAKLRLVCFRTPCPSRCPHAARLPFFRALWPSPHLEAFGRDLALEAVGAKRAKGNG